jgi:membrane associated rhomboid family serine protease
MTPADEPSPPPEAPVPDELLEAVLPPLPQDGDGPDAVIRCHERRKPLPQMAALASAKIPYRLEQRDFGWELHVPREQEAAARRELLTWRAVNRNWPPKALAVWHEHTAAYPGAGVWSLLPVAALLVFYWYTGPFDPDSAAHVAGCSDLEKIRAGEWWRCVTSLTQHADVPHVLGNSVALWAFGFAVCRSTGVGFGWLAILLAGFFGNLIPAWWMESDTGLAVGASTATFGALGALVMLQVRRNWHSWAGLRSAWSRSWVPLLAGLALLGFLGVSPGADLRGHFWGFTAGLGVGLLLLPVADRKLPWWVQAPLALAAAAAPVAAWHLALRGVP